MSRQPEAIFRDKVMNDLAGIQGVWATRIELFYKRGIPDIFVCIWGHFAVIEAKKSEKDKPTKLQTYVLSKIAEAGGSAIVAYPENWPQVRESIKAYAAKQGEKYVKADLSTH